MLIKNLIGRRGLPLTEDEKDELFVRAKQELHDAPEGAWKVPLREIMAILNQVGEGERPRTKYTRIFGYGLKRFRRGSWMLSGRDGTHLISWFDRRGENQDARLKITIGRLRVEWW